MDKSIQHLAGLTVCGSIPSPRCCRLVAIRSINCEKVCPIRSDLSLETRQEAPGNCRKSPIPEELDEEDGELDEEEELDECLTDALGSGPDEELDEKDEELNEEPDEGSVETRSTSEEERGEDEDRGELDNAVTAAASDRSAAVGRAPIEPRPIPESAP